MKEKIIKSITENGNLKRSEKEKIIKDLISDYENEVNKNINNLYDTFYIQEYITGSSYNKYGCIFNGEQIALARDIEALEQIMNAIIFLVKKGDFKK